MSGQQLCRANINTSCIKYESSKSILIQFNDAHFELKNVWSFISTALLDSDFILYAELKAVFFMYARFSETYYYQYYSVVLLVPKAWSFLAT